MGTNEITMVEVERIAEDAGLIQCSVRVAGGPDGEPGWWLANVQTKNWQRKFHKPSLGELLDTIAERLRG